MCGGNVEDFDESHEVKCGPKPGGGCSVSNRDKSKVFEEGFARERRSGTEDGESFNHRQRCQAWTSSCSNTREGEGSCGELLSFIFVNDLKLT